MGTKAHPGEFDCYAAAEDDEPIFVVLGHDPDGPETVEDWAWRRMRRLVRDHPEAHTSRADDECRRVLHKIANALTVANDMRDYLSRPPKQTIIGMDLGQEPVKPLCYDRNKGWNV